VRSDDLARLHPDKFVGHTFEQRRLVRDHEKRFPGRASL
jgi:hypothetical protein